MFFDVTWREGLWPTVPPLNLPLKLAPYTCNMRLWQSSGKACMVCSYTYNWPYLCTVVFTHWPARHTNCLWLVMLISDINHLNFQYSCTTVVTACLLLGVTMDTRNTVASSNQLVSSSGVGELLWSCDLVCMISDHVIGTYVRYYHGYKEYSCQ